MRKFATKRVLAVSLATAMAVSMTACGGKDPEPADSTPTPTEQGGATDQIGRAHV